MRICPYLPRDTLFLSGTRHEVPNALSCDLTTALDASEAWRARARVTARVLPARTADNSRLRGHGVAGGRGADRERERERDREGEGQGVPLNHTHKRRSSLPDRGTRSTLASRAQAAAAAAVDSRRVRMSNPGEQRNAHGVCVPARPPFGRGASFAALQQQNCVTHRHSTLCWSALPPQPKASPPVGSRAAMPDGATRRPSKVLAVARVSHACAPRGARSCGGDGRGRGAHRARHGPRAHQNRSSGTAVPGLRRSIRPATRILRSCRRLRRSLSHIVLSFAPIGGAPHGAAEAAAGLCFENRYANANALLPALVRVQMPWTCPTARRGRAAARATADTVTGPPGTSTNDLNLVVTALFDLQVCTRRSHHPPSPTKQLEIQRRRHTPKSDSALLSSWLTVAEGMTMAMTLS